MPPESVRVSKTAKMVREEPEGANWGLGEAGGGYSNDEVDARREVLIRVYLGEHGIGMHAECDVIVPLLLCLSAAEPMSPEGRGNDMREWVGSSSRHATTFRATARAGRTRSQAGPPDHPPPCIHHGNVVDDCRGEARETCACRIRGR